MNGYEGTGRSLSLKLIQKLREQSKMGDTDKSGSGARALKEVTLNDPIRYAVDDPIEKWLYDLLCLNVFLFIMINIYFLARQPILNH